MRAEVAVGALVLAAWPALAVPARVVDGIDRAVVIPPAGAVVRAYENDGYRLRTEPDGRVRIEVTLSPVASRAGFELPPRRADAGPVETVARAVTAAAHGRYEAVEKLLEWVATNIAYDLDRGADQAPERVLERRTAYCTGIARLTVALLGAVGIEAREVPGYVVEAVPGGAPVGFHRWIEVRYPDRGWVFSDPVSSHHFVPATYVRLADDRLDEGPAAGRLVERQQDVREIDELPVTAGAAPLRLRPNDERRHAAALSVRLAPAVAAEATLVGQGVRRSLDLPDGRGVFLGLEPGRYELRVEAAGRLAAWKQLTFRNRVLAELEVPIDDSRTESVPRR